MTLRRECMILRFRRGLERERERVATEIYINVQTTQTLLSKLIGLSTKRHQIATKTLLLCLSKYYQGGGSVHQVYFGSTYKTFKKRVGYNIAYPLFKGRRGVEFKYLHLYYFCMKYTIMYCLFFGYISFLNVQAIGSHFTAIAVEKIFMKYTNNELNL